MIPQLTQIADTLLKNDNFLLLTHVFPDGDTLGSAAALCRSLQKIGKSARIECGDKIPRKYDFLFEGILEQNFEERFIISVDVADIQLLGSLSCYQDRIDLCIDHHMSNTHYARESLVLQEDAATAEVVYKLLNHMPVEMDTLIARAIYTGITTDTGCFRYSNVTAQTHRITAELMAFPIGAEWINRQMFETKTKARLYLEQLVFSGISYHLGGRCAMITISSKLLQQSGAEESEIDGISAIPRQIEGVLVGITLREKHDGTFKISVRTNDDVSASRICSYCGGGGHKNAAGCTISGTLSEVEEKILKAVALELGETM